MNEFGATVDLHLQGNTFSSANGAAFGLDLGTAFSDVSNNYTRLSRNAGAYLMYGIHDGKFSHNHIAFVDRSTADYNAIGILAWGVQNITISENTLDGGAGSQSTVALHVKPDKMPEPERETFTA